MENIDSCYQAFFDKLVAYASNRIPRQEAEDIVQDVLVSVWKKWDALTFVNDIYAYCLSSVRHKCRDYVRHQVYVREYCKSASRVGMDYFLAPSASHLVEFVELKQRYDKAVEKLPCRCKAIYRKSRDEGMSYKQISAEMTISINTVEAQMSVALRKLRQQLKVS